MRKVVAYELMSVDGVVEAPDQFVLAWDDVMAENLFRVIGTQDDVLLGRSQHDDWAAYWPTATSDLEFATFINAVPKHVATSSALTIPWDGASAIDGAVEDFVADLKHGTGGDIGVHGSITLLHSLLRAGLVDELALVVSPVVAGAGRRLFEHDGGIRRLELTGSVMSPSGALLVGYRVHHD
jgi:dihydrofolate reductase